MFLKRKALEQLKAWKENSHGKSALLIEGARRVGKSCLVRSFVKESYKSFIYIDFGAVNADIRSLFDDTADLNFFFLKLQALSGVTLFERQSAIVFDEVQLFPRARQLIKYLVADGRYDYIETGSLLGIKHNVKDILIPSEEEKLILHPFDFEEFLWALGDEQLASFIRECFVKRKALGQALHRKAMDRLRLFMLVGGMPQAIVAYMESNSLTQVEITKRQIINLYRNDIAKYAYKAESKTRAIFDMIPSELSRHEKKFRLSHISDSARIHDYEESFFWLSDSGVSSICYNSTEPSIGLGLNLDNSTLKCYSADTGLLVTQAIDDGILASEDVLKSVLVGKLAINEGMLIENLVAQMLSASNHKLFFYSRPRGESSKACEIDFLIRSSKKICPIEVKSSNNIAHASLTDFVEKFKAHLGTSYLMCLKELSYDAHQDLLIMPLYMGYCL